MPDELRISKTTAPESPVVTRLFSLTDRLLWPAIALSAVCVIIILEFDVSTRDGTLTLSLGAVAWVTILVVFTLAVLKKSQHVSARRKLTRALRGRSQYLILDTNGISYGWDDAVSFFWRWDTVAYAEWAFGQVVLRMGDSRVSFSAALLSPEEADAFHRFLKERRLLRYSIPGRWRGLRLKRSTDH